jgi:hypothetical protein
MKFQAAVTGMNTGGRREKLRPAQSEMRWKQKKQEGQKRQKGYFVPFALLALFVSFLAALQSALSSIQRRAGVNTFLNT